MPEIRFVQPDGEVKPVDAPTGVSVMKAAVSAGIPGILAECGGQAMCATCHIHIQFTPSPLPEVGEEEDEMLECALSPRMESSRLSCQLSVTDELDGMVVYVPAEDL
ncbi:2Fe-2S iron-sulfur cluster-binding protein [Williamsia soli]|uniref:2Fe-2S iron-sulfur cluster-binding protein n=1 Tax=Williamsia soli TaxID=364929 RepID=UPI001A9F6737|nr:2Fe-2S iron-sulfur cluster-binding protein [Williamsia soli]